MAQTIGVHGREVGAASNEFSNVDPCGGHRSKFCHRPAVSCNGQALTPGHTIDDLATVVPQFSNRHIRHWVSVSRVIPERL